MATNYLLDTNMITALARKDAMAQARLRGLGPGDGLYGCFIIAGEWEYGIRCAPGERRQAEIRAAGEPIFAALTGVWESTPAIALEYGALRARLEAAGQVIPVNDLWIAATALAFDAVVVSTDPHFRRVKGLRVVDWTQP